MLLLLALEERAREEEEESRGLGKHEGFLLSTLDYGVFDRESRRAGRSVQSNINSSSGLNFSVDA